MSDPLRVGVLGAARITPVALIEPARRMAGVELVAVASRSRTRAEAFAAEHGIAEVATDYDELVGRDDLDLIYNALPASHHRRWSEAALEAGRHVLCEKPLAANADEARSMVATAERTGRRLIEAFHWRYHPLAERMIELVAALGTLERFEAEFSVTIGNRSDIRHRPELGGGSLMDLGCYPLSWGRTLIGEPQVVGARAVEGEPGVDVRFEADLVWPCGVEGAIRCSMEGAGSSERAAWLRVVGREGRLEVDNPLAPHLGHRLRHIDESGINDEQVEGHSTYAHQLAAVVEGLASGRPLATEGWSGVANMELIDACYRAAGMYPRRGLD